MKSIVFECGLNGAFKISSMKEHGELSVTKFEFYFILFFLLIHVDFLFTI